jgi:O-antigen/teichoic acid export membrane protein
MIGGFVAAAVALAMLPLLLPFFEIEASHGHYLLFSALAALVSLRSSGIALLRLYDRFDLLAQIDTATALLRTALSALAYALGGGLPAFVGIFVVVSFADGLVPYLFGRREMRRRGHKPAYAPLRDTVASNPGFLRLLWNSNVAVMLRQSTERLDTLILAAFLPPTAIGYYQIARRVGDAATRLGRPLKQTLYPELTRLAARAEWRRVRKLIVGTTVAIALALAIVLLPILVQIKALVVLAFGTQFAPAAPVVAIQSVAVALTLAGVILGPALLSLEHDRALVWTGAVTAAAFFVLLVPAVQVMGISGAAVTRLVSNAVWVLLAGLIVRQALRRTGATADLTAQGGVA